MSGKFLLDTNIIIALFTGDASIQKNLALASKVFIPVIVLGELYYGARKSGQMEKNLARIEEFEASGQYLGNNLRYKYGACIWLDQRPITKERTTNSRE